MSAPAKTAQVSGLEMRVLAKEISKLAGSYVSSIHSLGENQVFRMKNPEGEADLVVSPTLGAWVTKRPAHGVTNEFTTSLRQELVRLHLDGVTQLGLDRVLFFRFSGGDRELQLILELMPPGNIVLTRSDGVVVAALREFKGQHRTVAVGRTYVPPPQNRTSLEEVDDVTLADLLSREKTAGKAVGRGLSLPRRYVDEVLAKVSLTQEQPTPLPAEKVAEMARVIRGLLSSLEHPAPSVVESPAGLELMIVEPAHGTVVETAQTLSELMDKSFAHALVEAGDKSEPEREDREAKEIEVTLKRLEDQTEGLKKKAGVMRQLASEVRGASSVEEAAAIVQKASIDSALRKRLESQSSTAAAASSLFDEAKDAEAEVRRIQEAAQALTSRLKRARKVTPKSTVKLVTRQRKEWYEKFRWFFTSEGKLAVGGRDAQSNTILVKKHMEEGDVAYHADLFGSPFFILKEGARQTAAEVRQVGQATASFSSAWKTGLVAADAYWVAPDQVSSSAPSGEYLARGSFVIKGKKNFVTKNPVELAVGIDASGRIASGPEEAMMKQSLAYLVLIPSREKSSDTAKKVFVELKRLYGDGIGTNSLDDVMRALPTGGGKIIRRRDLRPAEQKGSA
jgi:predicted ribosome quality control (RQC) complex YloA/Tae2 family protein